MSLSRDAPVDPQLAQPHMPSVVVLRQSGLLHSLLQMSENHVDRIQAQLLAGSQFVRFADYTTYSSVARQSLAFLVSLLGRTEGLKLFDLKKLVRCLSLYSRLPGFLLLGL